MIVRAIYRQLIITKATGEGNGEREKKKIQPEMNQSRKIKRIFCGFGRRFLWEQAFLSLFVFLIAVFVFPDQS